MSPPTLLDLRRLAAADRMARPFVGTTGRNPTVGALIVDPRSGIVLGSGVTARSGRPHAEPRALALAGAAARGATLYVTLEPCHHTGDTPPCVDAVIAAGISRIVTFLADPDPRTSGKSLEKLDKAGIDVTVADSASCPVGLHEGYLSRTVKGRPFVTAKLAVSADGMIGREGEPNVPITGEESLRFTHVLRSRHEAILIGAETARIDNPLLDVRLKGLKDRSPFRWIALGQTPADPGLKVFAGQGAQTGIIAADPASAAALPDRVERLIVAQGPDAGIGWADALAKLGARGLQHLLVEGGAAILYSLLKARLVDRFYLLESVRPVGAGGIPASPGGEIRSAIVATGLREAGTRPLGADRVTVFERPL
ncbi:MAG: bifunctional diaminohydroxyphosphoribosylaminopyrimidine deaminase/5-amino-6-(5-phosphoribosylamino)uracil reductase RibD [Cucumibacter sp.]